MKNAKTLLAGLLLLGNIAATGTALAANDVISKDEATTGSYCHMKFPAIDGKTLGSDNPVLKSQASGDTVDFYGPCNENPVGQDQVQAQRLDREHRWETEND
jgi:hypothetical protein